MFRTTVTAMWRSYEEVVEKFSVLGADIVRRNYPDAAIEKAV